MLFSYKARAATGAPLEGVLEARDKFAVAKELRSRGEVPLSVVPIAERRGWHLSSKISGLFASVSVEEKIVFINNLSGMLSAGLTLYRALDVEYKQTTNPAFKTVISGLMFSINQGEEFSAALQKYPKVFSPLFSSMVHSGEESGALPKALKEIGSNLSKSHALTSKIQGALIYPAVIVGAIFAVAVLMLVFVIPTLTKIFTDFGASLPITTQMLIAVSNAASNHPVIFLSSIVIVIGGAFLIVRSKKMRRTNDAVSLKLPIVGSIVRGVNIARTARTLSSLLSSGIEMTSALSITRDVVQNSFYKDVLEKASVAVQKGETLSSVFVNELRLFPIMVGEMITVGEETGTLTSMLSDIANFYEDEVDLKTKNLSTIIEPVIMLIVGIAVGFFAVAMISPMYSLLNTIH